MPKILEVCPHCGQLLPEYEKHIVYIDGKRFDLSRELDREQLSLALSGEVYDHIEERDPGDENEQ